MRMTTNITIIAEGAETALSLQQSGIKGNIIASAGISNLRNYSPFPGEKIIIAADNDSKNPITNNTVIKAAKTLEMKGAITCIVNHQKMVILIICCKVVETSQLETL
ncbi:toprim domain protein [Orientia tsutsugamushi str. UT76]|nr:toprim domain protein [Orientia tsutsugamushi str. UT76]